ncbi:hypothetical protein OEZ86_001097 [Tetradesmus obliquus]|nr:hypothetical protein OEZ86_001097 [Tetradesmus obliquus]
MAVDVLHRSSYSTVFLGSPGVGAPLSCYKVYEKAALQARHWLNISRECCILSRLQEARIHGVVQLISVADTPQHFSLQFKPCLGGNLYQAIERKEFCDEALLCTKVIIPLLRVLEQLHARGIIHRDIKPENIFFEGDGTLVLGDFGLAIDSSSDKPCSRVGTHDYMAPEVMAQPSADMLALRNIPRTLLRPYSSAVDIWALGILVHEALTGCTPFSHPDAAVVALKTQFGAPCKLPDHVSAECQAFVDAVLHKQPGKRPSAAVLLQHPWLQQHMAEAELAAKPCRYSCALQRRMSSNLTDRTRSSNDSCSSNSSESNSSSRSSSSSCSIAATSANEDTSCCTATGSTAVLPLPQQSPSKACRMMKGVCKKMLHVLRHTQPGQAY